MVQFITASCHDKFTLTQVHIAYDTLFHELQNLSAILSISLEADVSPLDMSKFLLEVQEKVMLTFHQVNLQSSEAATAKTDAEIQARTAAENAYVEELCLTESSPTQERRMFQPQPRVVKVKLL